MNIAFAIDGVLRTPTGDFIQRGLVVYRAFKSLGRVVLMTDLDRERAEGFLLVNNIFDYDDLLTEEVRVNPDQPTRERQLEVIMNRGPVSIYVEADPDFATHGLHRGLTVLMFSDSPYSHYAFRPDAPKTVRPWDQVVEERNRQQAMLATDKRAIPETRNLGFE
jgi:hypothetical protein